MAHETVTQWCEYIAGVHQSTMELGLERVREVARRLDLLSPSASIITVAGTNGKGSTVAGLEAIYIAQGYRVGAFTSPYLVCLNEEFHLQGDAIDDASLCAAFQQIETARQAIALTVFEFNTLAALLIFKVAQCDVIILEVGLGGRLDAVNVIDADVAVVTTIALDHMEWLGNTRELIAREKAGIFRTGKPVVCGDYAPPATLRECATAVNAAPFYTARVDFDFYPAPGGWGWKSEQTQLEHLPLPPLALQNMSTVLMTVEVMQPRLPVNPAAIEAAFNQVNLSGRIQIVAGAITRIFDVAHNPAAVQWLADKLRAQAISGKIHAVFSMLGDKDIEGTLNAIKPLIDYWYIAELTAARAASIEQLRTALRAAGINHVLACTDITSAYAKACAAARDGDCVLVFGSFYTVGAVCAMV